ncbi:alternative sulfate transporter [Thozetella sp. PMI_491]|nr:alternative sulfate transporter [Thozetella sp. PMI_491]
MSQVYEESSNNAVKEERIAADVASTLQSEAQLGQVLEKDWTDEDERRVVRKLDCSLMVLLVLGFFSLQLDRSNISNALTSTITKDLGVTTSEISSGNQLQLAGIIIAEIPANMLLQKVGTSLWLTIQCICWGLVGVFQAFISNKASFYATRFLLGLFEAGYIPGSLLLMSLFYTRKEAAVRCAVFYFGNNFATGTGSLIAAGILQMAGRHGLGGWQWLFILDGSCTIVMAIAFFFLLPASPLRTLPLSRIKAFDFFSDRDRHIMHSRIVLDDPNKKSDFSHFTFRQFFDTIRDWNLWGHFAINLLGLAPKGGLQLFSPSVIKALGFSTTNANALSSVSSYGVCVLSFLVSWASDAQKLRGPWCIACCAWSMIFAGVMYGTPNSTSWTRFALFTLLNSGNGVSQSLNDAWLSSNAPSHQKRSIGLALAVIGSNLGGLAGQQLFQENDAPRYNNAWLGILCLYAAAMAMITLQIGSYMWGNKRLARAQAQQEDPSISGDNAEGMGRRYEL